MEGSKRLRLKGRITLHQIVTLNCDMVTHIFNNHTWSRTVDLIILPNGLVPFFVKITIVIVEVIIGNKILRGSPGSSDPRSIVF